MIIYIYDCNCDDDYIIYVNRCYFSYSDHNGDINDDDSDYGCDNDCDYDDSNDDCNDDMKKKSKE